MVYVAGTKNTCQELGNCWMRVLRTEEILLHLFYDAIALTLVGGRKAESRPQAFGEGLYELRPIDGGIVTNYYRRGAMYEVNMDG